MNTTASFLPEPSWSRRCSTETVLSIQGKETDIVQDSSDSEWGSNDELEYEPVSYSEAEVPISEGTSGPSDAELTKSVAVVPGEDDGDELADSERSGASECESELPQYSRCARCQEKNGNKRFRYCDKCFQLRKNFFPPRPRRKPKQDSLSQESLPSSYSQESGIGSLDSQELTSSQDVYSQGSSSQQHSQPDSQGPAGSPRAPPAGKAKRRSESADRARKRPRLASDCEECEECEDAEPAAVAPLVKAASDPAVTVESLEGGALCIVCLARPKSGVFVHRRVAHICCCYPCALKVWSKARRCPICNCKVSNVLKAIVM